jgi:hypothetical protein
MGPAPWLYSVACFPSSVEAKRATVVRRNKSAPNYSVPPSVARWPSDTVARMITRRGIFGALAGLCGLPFVAKALPKASEQVPQVDGPDVFTILPREEPPEPQRACEGGDVFTYSGVDPEYLLRINGHTVLPGENVNICYATVNGVTHRYISSGVRR